MFGWGPSTTAEAQATLSALSRSLAIIEFDIQGVVLTANENFCKAMGYDLSEIKGQHHKIFVEPGFALSADYREFWAKLGRGEYDSREYKRIGKSGADVWIQATYNPVLNAKNQVIKVVKLATVTTQTKLKNVEYEGKLNAISLAQALIEFTPEGEIITANQNFLDLMGYRLEDLQGRHHRLCVDPAYAKSEEYAAFWQKLRAGEYTSSSFKRYGKGGREVWIRASYNPIFDLNGKVIKVVKFANDITDLTNIASGLARMARNDFSTTIEQPFHPAYEQLRVDFNAAHDGLRSALLQVADSVLVIQSGTGEIAGASDDLSRRTEQQAASLEETAAALGEITATVKKTSEGAKHARDAVDAAKRDAEGSGTIVRKAVDAMGEIERSSGQIGQIIGVIDEIAFQTNLLALNAGVEAARAGDAGRGFAVVASEVRALAQRSAEAAKEIKALINTSSNQVAAGVSLVGETGTALQGIVVQINEINHVVTDIASSAVEQATALDQINTAVVQMDQVTQQNAAMVEEATAASHSLAHEIEQLTQLVERFQTGRGQPTAHAAPRRVASRPSHNTVTAMKQTARSNGGAAMRKPAPAPVADESWEEF